MSVYSARFSVASSTNPDFTRPQGTEPPSSPAEHPSARAIRVNQWLASAEARAYDDTWVLLSDACQVLDHDQSAVALTSRHAEQADPLVVFVQAPRIRIG